MAQIYENYSTGGTSGRPDYEIGPSQGSMQLLNRLARQPSRDLPSAIAQIGAAFIQSHAKKKKAEAARMQQEERALKRSGWADALGAGETLRGLAANDPTILGDQDFIKFWTSTEKGPDPETFEIADDPYGRGGIGQRSSTTGKIIGYQGPLAPEGPAPETFEDVQDPYGRGGVGQRSSTTGKIIGYQGALPQTPARDRKTAKDMFGRLRYLDDGEPAFGDDILGHAPEADAPTTLKDRLSMVRDLSSDWQATVRPMQSLLDQSDRMEIGLRMAQEGDMLAGSQAILISFNKLLDPTSVVRESEYARSASGQSALETMRGFVDKLSKGGAGVTLEELQSYARFGEEVVQRALESTVGPERERISRLVEFAGVDPELIFSGRFAPKPPQGEAPPGQPQGQELPNSNAPLARALVGGQTAATLGAPQAPQGQAPQAPGAMTGGDNPRIAMYADMPKDALKRQVAQMAAKLAANPEAYSQAEINAAKGAYDIAFPEG